MKTRYVKKVNIDWVNQTAVINVDQQKRIKGGGDILIDETVTG